MRWLWFKGKNRSHFGFERVHGKRVYQINAVIIVIAVKNQHYGIPGKPIHLPQVNINK